MEIYKLWIAKRKYCFEEDKDLKEAFLNWFKEVKTTDFVKEGFLDKRLILGFSIYVESEISSTTRNIEMEKIENALKEEEEMCGPDILFFPHHQQIIGNSDFLDFHPFEFARQITIIDSTLLRKIKAHEWIGKGLSSGKSVNLINLINRFNKFSGWVATIVCLGPTIEIRVLIIKYLLACALALTTLNNFNATMAIISGLSMGPVVRLLQTWSALGAAAKWFDLIKQLMGMEKNFKKLRSYEELQSENCIPYLGMYTKDLMFIEEGNPDFEENGLINFDKRHMVATVIAKMEHFAKARYSLTPVPEIQEYLEKIYCIQEDDLYLESLERESKQANAKLKEKNAKKGIY